MARPESGKGTSAAEAGDDRYSRRGTREACQRRERERERRRISPVRDEGSELQRGHKERKRGEKRGDTGDRDGNCEQKRRAERRRRAKSALTRQGKGEGEGIATARVTEAEMDTDEDTYGASGAPQIRRRATKSKPRRWARGRSGRRE